MREIELASLADTRIPLFVEVARERFRRDQRVELVVRAADLERIIDAPLFGPRN